MRKKLAISILIISLIPTMCFAQFADMPSDWSREPLLKAVENGILNGYDGKIEPLQNMTRAQLAAVMVRVFGAENEADISQFKDVYDTDWYYHDVAKAVYMGAFKISDNFSPQAFVTREEVFVVISRLFNLPEGSNNDLKNFVDANEVSSWAKDGVSAIILSGYVKGDGERINPKNNITRGEFAAVIDRIIPNYITSPGIYTSLPEGNVMIRSEGVVIDGVSTTFDVIIGDGVKEGATIKNADFKGRTIIRGGADKVEISGVFNTVLITMPHINVNGENAKISALGVRGNSNIFLGMSK